MVINKSSSGSIGTAVTPLITAYATWDDRFCRDSGVAFSCACFFCSCLPNPNRNETSSATQRIREKKSRTWLEYSHRQCLPPSPHSIFKSPRRIQTGNACARRGWISSGCARAHLPRRRRRGRCLPPCPWAPQAATGLEYPLASRSLPRAEPHASNRGHSWLRLAVPSPFARATEPGSVSKAVTRATTTY